MILAEILARVDKRLAALGLSDNKASELARKPDAIRNMRRAVKDGKDQKPKIETLNALAPVLETTTAWLLASAGPETPGRPSSSSLVILEGKAPATIRSQADFVLATYGGIVEATAFRPVDDIADPDRGPELVPRDERYPRGEYVLFDVVGDSMNAADPPIQAGSRVIAIRVDDPYRPLALQTGDIVVVRRTQQQGGLVELSVKELELGEAETLYLPRSKNKRHQPIRVPKNLNTDDETVIEVLGLVIDVMTRVRRR